MVKKIITALLLAILVLCGTGLVTQYYLDKFSAPTPQAENNDKLKKENNKPGFTKPLNILVIGIDQNGYEKGRSDTITVYHLEPAVNKISLLTVPRDTYVNIPGREKDKINHAYAFGGISLSRKTVEEFLRIKIDYYIVINFVGFVDLIDQIGGITVNVEKDIPGADIKKGQQKLDGHRALAYVRDRDDPMGDIARVKRQQKFLKALALEISQYNSKWKLAPKIHQMYKSINTDLSPEELQTLYVMFQKTDPAAIQMEIVPGSFYNLRGISYWKPDKTQTDLIIQKMFNQH